MAIADHLQEKVKQRLINDYGMRDAGAWLRGGKCPKCGKKELFARADRPAMIVCGRKDKCGEELSVREVYPDLFEDASAQTRHDPSPTAAADFYLGHVRGFDLQYLRGAYTQEFYQDRKLGIGSATVRFPLPNGSWWERLIDQPSRFPRKANFAPASSYQGHAWTLPQRTIADYAAADEIWLVEGIFDACALEQGAFRRDRAEGTSGTLCASLMSCYNWPEHFLRDLRVAIASGPTPTRSPLIVFALDLGAAGTEYTRKFVARARAEGWHAAAAQVRADDDPGAKLDWNDLLLRDRLSADHRAEYRWAGDVLVAETEREKAYLIWKRRKWKSFDFTFAGRTWWANMSEAKIEEMIATGFKSEPEISVASLDVKYDYAARATMGVECIANCTFRSLYFERNEMTDTSAYWLQVNRPGDAFGAVKASFPGPALAGSGEFKKRLLSVASGAIWTGEQHQLDRMMQRQLPVRDVTSIEFTGYCRDHQVYVLGDIAVHKGRVHHLNDDGYFDIGKAAIKLRTAERMLDSIEYDPDRFDQSWLPDFHAAWGAKGIVLLTFMGGLALIAEQVRQNNKSLGFLEVTGIAGSGKSTAVEFIWKLLGRDSYEGFDPAKSTQAGIARELAKAANLPVVFIEGDRTEETPHSKRFDWEETKTLYNGRATRTRGVKSEGLETYSPPFRGAFVIVQNDPVNASRAVLERIMAIEFDKSSWSINSRAAAKRLESIPVEQISGYIIHFARAEAKIMATYLERFPHHEKRLLAMDGIANHRLAETHAKLLAMLDAFEHVLTGLQPGWIADAYELIERMAFDRHIAIASDHPIVETFWERFDYLQDHEHPDHPNNHSRDPEKTIAVHLTEFEERCAHRKLQIPPVADLRKHLKTSRRHPFIGAKPVNSVTNKTLHCWVFQRNAKPGA